MQSALLFYLLTVDLPNHDYFEVGQSYSVNCTVYTGKEINPGNVSISWRGPDGVITNNSSRIYITVIPTTRDGHIHTSTLHFSNISGEDEGTLYYCTGSLFGGQELLSESFTVTTLICKLDY